VRSREQNAELRTREHLTPGEVEAAKANRDATMILVAFGHGLRAATLNLFYDLHSLRPLPWAF
jgi:hypothetical protein